MESLHRKRFLNPFAFATREWIVCVDVAERGGSHLLLSCLLRSLKLKTMFLPRQQWSNSTKHPLRSFKLKTLFLPRQQWSKSMRTTTSIRMFPLTMTKRPLLVQAKMKKKKKNSPSPSGLILESITPGLRRIDRKRMK